MIQNPASVEYKGHWSEKSNIPKSKSPRKESFAVETYQSIVGTGRTGTPFEALYPVLMGYVCPEGLNLALVKY